MSRPLTSPESSPALVRVLIQQVDAELALDHETGTEAIRVIRFAEPVPALWWLDAISVVSTMFASREVFLTFLFKSAPEFRKATVRFLVP